MCSFQLQTRLERHIEASYRASRRCENAHFLCRNRYFTIISHHRLLSHISISTGPSDLSIALLFNILFWNVQKLCSRPRLVQKQLARNGATVSALALTTKPCRRLVQLYGPEKYANTSRGQFSFGKERRITQGLGEGETFHANMGKPCTVALASISGRESRQQHDLIALKRRFLVSPFYRSSSSKQLLDCFRGQCPSPKHHVPVIYC
jgi:hypothetical protein